MSMHCNTSAGQDFTFHAEGFRQLSSVASTSRFSRAFNGASVAEQCGQALGVNHDFIQRLSDMFQQCLVEDVVSIKFDLDTKFSCILSTCNQLILQFPIISPKVRSTCNLRMCWETRVLVIQATLQRFVFFRLERWIPLRLLIMSIPLTQAESLRPQ